MQSTVADSRWRRWYAYGTLGVAYFPAFIMLGIAVPTETEAVVVGCYAAVAVAFTLRKHRKLD